MAIILGLVNILLDIFSFVPGPVGLVSSIGRSSTNYYSDYDSYSYSSYSSGYTVPVVAKSATSFTKDATKLYNTMNNAAQASGGALKSISKMASGSVSASAKFGKQVAHAGNAFRGAGNAFGRVMSTIFYVPSMIFNSFQLMRDIFSLFK